MGYFNIEKKMSIAASLQHAAFANGEVLCDWTSIQVPKGSACLRSAVVIVRPKGAGGANPTINNFPIDILFSKTNTVSLGTVGAAVAHAPSNDFLGVIEVDAANYASGAYQSSSIATLGNDIGGGTPPIVLTGDPTTGDNVGYDTIYVGIIARDAFDFTSINAIAEAGDAEAATTKVITMDGTGMDVREHFAAGDVVHIGTSVGSPAADSLIGTIASADSATQITLTDVSATALVDGDILYNLHPIKLVLGFER